MLDGTLACESTSTIGRFKYVAWDTGGACATRVFILLVPLIVVVVSPEAAGGGGSRPSITLAIWFSRSFSYWNRFNDTAFVIPNKVDLRQRFPTGVLPTIRFYKIPNQTWADLRIRVPKAKVLFT